MVYKHVRNDLLTTDLPPLPSNYAHGIVYKYRQRNTIHTNHTIFSHTPQYLITIVFSVEWLEKHS